MEKFLLWTDLETSGTDESKDKILEVGMSLRHLDNNSQEIDAFQTPIYPEPGLSFEFTATVDPLVNQMHRKSGLWDDVYKNGVSILNAQVLTLAWLGKYGKPHEFILAGSGVSHFDRRFIAAQMPEVDKWFKYYCIDVGVMRRSLTYMGYGDLVMPAEHVSKDHRALADARLHADEFDYIAERIGWLRKRGTT